MIHITKTIGLQDRLREKSEYTRKLLIVYLVFQVLVIAASHYIASVDVSVIQWLGNFAGLCIFAAAFFVRRHAVERDIFILAVVNFVGQLVPTVVYEEHLLDSMKSLGLNINIAAVLLYFLVFGGMQGIKFTGEDAQRILRAVLLISAAVGVITLLMDAPKIALLFQSVNAYSIDFSGFFDNKNGLGSYAAIGLMVGIYFLHTQEKKLFTLIMSVIVAVVLVCTLSRTAILAAVMFALVFLLRRAHAGMRSGENYFLKKYARRIRILVFLGILGCVILYLKSDMIQQFVLTKLIRSSAGTAGRDTIWKTVVSSFDDSAVFHLFGMGYSELNFRSAADCHNIYLYIYATGGLVKACVYALLLGKAFQMISRLKQKNVVLADFCFSAAIAYLTLGMFETNLLFELGLVNFEYALFVLFIPAMCTAEEKAGDSVVRYE